MSRPSFGRRLLLRLQHLVGRCAFSVKPDREGLFVELRVPMIIRRSERPEPWWLRPRRPELHLFERLYLWSDARRLATWLLEQPRDRALYMAWDNHGLAEVPAYLVGPLSREVSDVIDRWDRLSAGWDAAWDADGRPRVGRPT